MRAAGDAPPISTRRMADALDALAAVERRSRFLRPLGSRAGPWTAGARAATRADLDRSRLPFDLPREPDGSVLPDASLAADAVLVSSLPDAPLRLRAFYVDAGLTLTLHRLRWLRPSALLRGSRVAERFRDCRVFAIPTQRERGRGTRRAWVIEDLVPGRTVRGPEWPAIFDRVAEGVGELWRHGELRPRHALDRLRWYRADRFERLLAAMELEPMARDRLFTRVDAIATSRGTVLAGWTHGDPVPNNVLHAPGERLALVDWERAGRNSVGLDVCRMLAPLDDPADGLAALERQLPPDRSAGCLSLAEQAAIEVVGLMPTWERQERSWRRAGRIEAYRSRNARRLRLLEQLLGV